MRIELYKVKKGRAKEFVSSYERAGHPIIEPFFSFKVEDFLWNEFIWEIRCVEISSDWNVIVLEKKDDFRRFGNSLSSQLFVHDWTDALKFLGVFHEIYKTQKRGLNVAIRFIPCSGKENMD